jgi:hypothetical protein
VREVSAEVNPLAHTSRAYLLTCQSIITNVCIPVQLRVSIRDSVACIARTCACLCRILPALFNALECACACVNACVMWKDDPQLIRDFKILHYHNYNILYARQRVYVNISSSP